MTWVAWRQFRTQALVAVAALVLLALVLIPTGAQLRHLFDTDVVPCLHGTSTNDCTTVINSYVRRDNQLQGWLGLLIAITPALIGVFWGAPLVARELESGTYRLAWTQSATRARWLVTKLAVVGVASMVTAGLLSLLVTWWYSPFDRLAADQFSTFDQRDLVAVGYAAFAFALGVTAGVLIRRTLPAMAATLVAFVTARLLFIQLARPNLLAPRHLSQALDPQSMGFFASNGGPMHLQPSPPDLPNAWVQSTRIVDRAGHGLPSSVVARTCPSLANGRPAGAPPVGVSGQAVKLRVPAEVQQTLHDCVSKLSANYHQVVTYQPADRYWSFQWLESAIFLGSALVLAGFSFWWVRRRLS